MKIYFSIILCLFISNLSVAQVEFKGFFSGQFYEFRQINQNTLGENYPEDMKGFSLSPSLGIAFNRNEFFHEVQLLNISNNTTIQGRNSTNQYKETETKSRSVGARYSYNFHILSEPKNWSPFLGLQTTQTISRLKFTQDNTTLVSTSFVNNQGVIGGVQYKIKENIKLEFAIPFNVASLVHIRSNSNSFTYTNWEFNRTFRERFQLRFGIAIIF